MVAVKTPAVRLSRKYLSFGNILALAKDMNPQNIHHSCVNSHWEANHIMSY